MSSFSNKLVVFFRLIRALVEQVRCSAVAREKSSLQNGEVTIIFNRSRRVSGGHWVFEVVAGLDLGRRYVGITNEIKIGRHPENHIHLRDPQVSRFHAVLRRRGIKLALEDLGSTNGTQLNANKVISKMLLRSGDLIKLGETVLRVSLEQDPKPLK